MPANADNNYGVNEVNNISDVPDEIRYAPRDITVDWADSGLARITRLRLISDPGLPFWDVSYCWGVLKNGEHVRVSLPFYQLPKRGWKARIITYAREDGVYAKALGLFDPSTVSTLV